MRTRQGRAVNDWQFGDQHVRTKVHVLVPTEVTHVDVGLIPLSSLRDGSLGASRSLRCRGAAGGPVMAEASSALARGLPGSLGRGSLHDAAGAREVPHARFRPARQRQRPDRVHRSELRGSRPLPSSGSRQPTTFLRAVRSCSGIRPADDPCILVRDVSGRTRRVLPGLHPSVVRGRAPAGRAGARRVRATRDRSHPADGQPLAGPPTRRLPRIVIEQRGDEIVATGIEV